MKMAKQSGPNMAGPDIFPEVNLEPGMNFEQWTRDRAGFRTSDAMVTGGMSCMFGEYAGPEVGENYQGATGEGRTEPTYVESNAMHCMDGDHPGAMAAEGSVTPGQFQKKSTTGRGKSYLRAPQNYRTSY